MRIVALFMVLVIGTCAAAQDVAQHLQDVSVTISSGESSGSGILITRDVKLKKDDAQTVKVNFVWTAAHVIDNLRAVKTVVDPSTGTEKKVVEYAPVHIVKELVEEGRKVGETRMEARVLKYSDAESRHDLALLMVLKKNYIDVNTEFYLDDTIPVIGTRLFHVGSLLGQSGSNSMTTGIVSQIGRTLNLDGTNVAVFDQTTVTAFPGSSGGGIFLAEEGPNKGKYVGMLVRGAGETFNLMVPVRRMRSFAKEGKLEWALDKTIEVPSLEEILEHPIDDVRTKSNSLNKPAVDQAKDFDFLIKEEIQDE